MNDSMTELENLIVLNLQSANHYKNEAEKKENEKYDQLKDISLGIIDILDSFERVEESLIEKAIDKNEEASKVMNRYRTIQRKLLNLLQKYQLQPTLLPQVRVELHLKGQRHFPQFLKTAPMKVRLYLGSTILNKRDIKTACQLFRIGQASRLQLPIETPD